MKLCVLRMEMGEKKNVDNDMEKTLEVDGTVIHVRVNFSESLVESGITRYGYHAIHPLESVWFLGSFALEI